MHGRKREHKVLTEDEKKIKAEKIAKYNRLKVAVLDRNSKRIYDNIGNTVSAKLAALNPDFYTLFNYRRNLLLHDFQQPDVDKSKVCTAELRLIEQGLAKNPKSYPAWTHREWVIDQGTTNLQSEIDLCSKFLGMDSRNFHCWNYRRVIVKKFGTRECLEAEFQFTMDKINEDFSNYSSWHYRSKLLPQIYAGKAQEEVDAALDNEFELVKQAFFTEPEDQSGWLYHRWLLSRVCVAGFSLSGAGISLGIANKIEHATVQDVKEEEDDKVDGRDREGKVPDTEQARRRQLFVFERELSTCRELLEIEPNCKWVLLTVALLMGGVEAIKTLTGAAVDAAVRDKDIAYMQGIFEKLEVLDPMRVNYYGDIQKQVMMQIANKGT
jgi:geranylgeranyl transferase type-2 subunit alpha